jgi:two-component system, sensor histidine kinase
MDQASQHVDRMRAEQVAALFQHVALGVTGAAAASVILAGGLTHIGVLDFLPAALWVSYIVVCASAHLVLRHLYYSARPKEHEWRRWAAWFTAVSLAEGIGWGWSAVAIADDRFATEMLILVVALNIAGAAIPTFGSYLPAFFAFFFPTTIPCVLWGIASVHSFPEAPTMLLLMLLYVFAMGGVGLIHNRSFKELVDLRIKTSVLAEDLRTQKELAERANHAKSTFLAAASHDLRQPVHALGLFVGALRAIPLTPEGVQLVDRIEQSTIAMDSLFSAILDISRLDAGVIEAHAEAFDLQPLLDRICSDYAEEAKQKSISLVQCRSGATVDTDPVLIERILRNLVSNAVRHTDAGRVVVGCRRRGDKIRVEVWDTGPGIPDSDRDRIFQEYFQLRNPERDRTKGLGLGLAIVRRLANLLQCPISLRAELGRGSCFAIEMPKATAKARLIDALANTSVMSGRGLVMVIDDEIAIREAMNSLLTGWGYEVVTADSGVEMLAYLSKNPVRPDIVICDYRLRGQENGIDVIHSIQSHFDQALPAMLITGDTAVDRLVEAQASGFLLLHKPVPNGKLRAAIVNLIAASKLQGRGLASSSN